jgi:Type IV secretion system pilin
MDIISRAFAQTSVGSTSGGTTGSTIQSPINSVQGLLNLMCTIFGWMFYGLIAVSIIMILVAGFNYVTAGDNAEKVGKANKIILYAAIGIAVALLAKAVPAIVASFIGAQGTLSSC